MIWGNREQPLRLELASTASSWGVSYPYCTSRAGLFGARHGWRYDRTGSDHASICDDHRRAASALPSIAATMATGAHVGDYAVIATADGYLGLQAPPP